MKLAYIILGIMLISLASAEVYQVNEPINLAVGCDLVNCSSKLNISISYPNSTLLVDNQAMSTSHTHANYSFTPDVLGEYKVYTSDLDEGYYSFSITINYIGNELTQEQSYIYILGFITVLLLILGTYILKEYLPSGDVRGEDNEILQINQLKHLRAVFWSIIWILVVVEVYILMNISLAYLMNDLMASLFRTIFDLMFRVMIIGVPIYWCYILYRAYKDNQMQDMIYRTGGLNRT
jgi:ABC-type sugar transport system permease subunit